MTLKEGGVLVARGLAIVLLARTLTVLVAGVFLWATIPAGPQGDMGRSLSLRSLSAYFVEGAVGFLFAGVLWRGAAKFTADLPSPTSASPVDAVGLLKVFIAAIAVYWLFSYIYSIVQSIAGYMAGTWTPENKASLIGDIVMSLAAIITTVWATRGLSSLSSISNTAARVASYPRSETYEEDEEGLK